MTKHKKYVADARRAATKRDPLETLYLMPSAAGIDYEDFDDDR